MGLGERDPETETETERDRDGEGEGETEKEKEKEEERGEDQQPPCLQSGLPTSLFRHGKHLSRMFIISGAS